MDDKKGSDSLCCIVDMVSGLNGIAVHVQNRVLGNVNYSEGSSGEGLRMYKRRKHENTPIPNVELLHKGKNFANLTSKCQYEIIKESGDRVLPNASCGQATLARVDSLSLVNDSNNGLPLKSPTNIILDQIYKSISKTGGSLHGCLVDALSHRGSNCRTADKSGGANTKQIISGIQNAKEVHADAMPNGLHYEAANNKITKLCQQALVDTIMSDKFAQLCCLLLENFPGLRVDEFLDIRNINSRMEDRTYETSPDLFQHDIKQLLTKVQNVGIEMVSIGKHLVEKSSAACQEQIGGFIIEDDKHEVLSEESIDVFKVLDCQFCGEQAEGKDCLVCDSCEEMHHFSCIEPAIKEIPQTSWFCLKCTAIQSPHENRVVLEELKSSSAGADSEKGTDFEEENSNDSDDDNCYPNNCLICGGEVENREDFKECGHKYCPHKYYHIKCLTTKQMNTYGSGCWYCPSCICSTCLVDKDDDKIVLCDSCDQAYHIYCMQPPLDRIPTGKWFCIKCEGKIQQIKRVRRAYEMIQNQKQSDSVKNIDLGKKRKHDDDDDKVGKSVGGVDMLLNAAKTIEISTKDS